jgi:hypothetical protein
MTAYAGDGRLQPRPRQAIRLWAMALSCSLLVLAGCSATRLLYNNLDWLAFEALDERFDVRADQVDGVERRLEQLHDWHRRTQLPAYRRTLSDLAARVADGLSLADLNWLESRIEIHRLALVERLVPDLAAFLADLDNAQIARFAEVSEKQLTEDAEPLGLEPADRAAQRLDAFIERIEPWTGTLSQAQTTALAANVGRQPDLLGAWISHRRERRDALLTVLADRPQAAEIEALLFGWWRDLEKGYPGDYAVARAAARDALFDLLVKLDASLDAKQRKRVVERLDDYRIDVETVLASS